MESQLSLGSEVVTVNVHAAKELLGSGHRYLDVRGTSVVLEHSDIDCQKYLENCTRVEVLGTRTEEEFKKGHVENALNIPYMFSTPEGRVRNPKFLEQVLSACSKEDHLVVGCQSGVRSVYATSDLLSADFKKVWNMGGGYLDWVDKGFPVEDPADLIKSDL